MPSTARVGRLLRLALPAAFSVGMFLQFGRCIPVGTSHSDAAGADEGASGERSRKASTRVQAKMGRARWGCAESGALLQGRDALVFAAEPVFAGLFGYLLAGDRLGAMGWAGC